MDRQVADRLTHNLPRPSTAGEFFLQRICDELQFLRETSEEYRRQQEDQDKPYNPDAPATPQNLPPGTEHVKEQEAAQQTEQQPEPEQEEQEAKGEEADPAPEMDEDEAAYNARVAEHKKKKRKRKK